MDDDSPFAAAREDADALADTLQASASTFSRVIRRGLKDALIDGRSLGDVLRKAALSVSRQALNASLKPLGDLLTGGMPKVAGGGFNFASLMPFAEGGVAPGAGAAVAEAARKAASGVRVVPFAEGGVIGAPTAFPIGRGAMGLMGEAGREAVLPLARGPDGRLGVALEGEGRGAVTVNFNVTTPDVGGFQRSEAQMTAMLARAVGRGRRGL